MENAIRQITEQLNRLIREKESVIVAIDGACTSGKTTLAEALSNLYDCNVFHMDDFFLRQEQRTKERLAEAGGNVDYERFLAEVLLPLGKKESFSYRPYDCHAGALKDDVKVVPKKLNIVEGTYSMHPTLTDRYDYTIYLTIANEKQKERILFRNPALHQRFFEEWIPMEQAYFSGCEVRGRCDITFDTTKWKEL